MRNGFFPLVTLALTAAVSGADDNKVPPSTEDDGKALVASLWVNDKPDAAWNQLSEGEKQHYGGKGWKRAEIEFIDSSKNPAKGPTIRFFADGSDKPLATYGAGFALREEKGTRYLSITNQDGVEQKIEYAVKGGRLSLKGTYLSRDPKKAPFPPTPVALDGEYAATSLKK
jgi:hypothetical protein